MLSKSQQQVSTPLFIFQLQEQVLPPIWAAWLMSSLLLLHLKRERDVCPVLSWEGGAEKKKRRLQSEWS